MFGLSSLNSLRMVRQLYSYVLDRKNFAKIWQQSKLVAQFLEGFG